MSPENLFTKNRHEKYSVNPAHTLWGAKSSKVLPVEPDACEMRWPFNDYVRKSSEAVINVDRFGAYLPLYWESFHTVVRIDSMNGINRSFVKLEMFIERQLIEQLLIGF